MKLYTKALLLGLCLFSSQNLYSIEKLRFIGDHTYKTGEIFNNTILGGLSGITYDHKTNRLLSVSDDPSNMNHARFYEFEIKLDLKTLEIKTTDVVLLKTKSGEYYPKNIPDFEGITLINGDVYISSEGKIGKYGVLSQPTVFIHKRNGDFIGELPIDKKYHFYRDDMTPGKRYGSRGNKVFESLSATENGKILYLATEDAIFTDGQMTNGQEGGIVRVMHFKDLAPNPVEFPYRLEKIEAPEGTDLTGADNGLAEILAIDDKTFYSLERSYVPALKKNGNKLFKNTIEKETTEVSKLTRLHEQKLTFIKKELVLNLDDVVPELTIKALDNMEGMTFGPTLPNGNRSLIVVSDNNFGKGQRTLFIAFEIIPSP